MSSPVSRLKDWVGLNSICGPAMVWFDVWVWATTLVWLVPSPLLESSTIVCSLSLPSLFTKDLINPSVDSGIWPHAHVSPHNHKGRSSFNLSRLNIITISESLSVADEESVTSLIYPLVINGPDPLTHIQCTELFSWTPCSGDKVLVTFWEGHWFKGGIACVFWFEIGGCVTSGDDREELTGVGGTDPLFKDIDRIAEFRITWSLSCCSRGWWVSCVGWGVGDIGVF